MSGNKSIKSPCINLCSLDDKDICIGCYRSGAEITIWGRSTPEEQRQILIKVQERERNSPFYSE
ncbi:DUF1289 domain-containing protein [Marinomonas sp. 15G1-11]|uniref:DUF1289 domain-containing protein n=1 Tax=Marinomonas phaeophyticola TaxID=3004091 RepID=A0ABT4JX15_9GAMM|nr:DUF1289 domain-containing protein [Marinomonas sp. 15G1-11]MCZ2722920.1 DUF1289 domain-containing protein [Marinomonas sp. 15G1-11]